MERQLSSVCNRFQAKFQRMLFFAHERCINVESTHWRSHQPLENGRGGSISGKGTRETLASSCWRMDAKFSRFDSTALQRWLNRRSQTPGCGYSGIWKLGKWGVERLKHGELLKLPSQPCWRTHIPSFRRRLRMPEQWVAIRIKYHNWLCRLVLRNVYVDQTYTWGHRSPIIGLPYITFQWPRDYCPESSFCESTFKVNPPCI